MNELWRALLLLVTTTAAVSEAIHRNKSSAGWLPRRRIPEHNLLCKQVAGWRPKRLKSATGTETVSQMDELFLGGVKTKCLCSYSWEQMCGHVSDTVLMCVKTWLDYLNAGVMNAYKLCNISKTKFQHNTLFFVHMDVVCGHILLSFSVTLTLLWCLMSMLNMVKVLCKSTANLLSMLNLQQLFLPCQLADIHMPTNGHLFHSLGH